MAEKTKYPGITKLGPGLYRVRVWAKNPKTGEYKETQRRVRGTLADARAEQVAAREAAQAGAPEKRQRVTLAAYADTWIERGKARGKRYSTLLVHVSNLELHILPSLGAYYIDAITRRDVEQWFDDCTRRRRGDGGDAAAYKPRTLNKWLQTLTALLQSWCDEQDPPAGNPAAKVRPLPVDEVIESENCLTADQAARLLEYTREAEPQWYAFIYLGLTTGARLGELTALQWDDIDERAALIRIQRSQVKGRVAGTKTRRARIVPLTPEMAEVLRWHRLRLVETQHPGVASGLIFPSRKGKHILQQPPRQAMVRLCKRAGVPTLTPKGMRRTFNDLLRRAGVDRLVLRSMTGHSSESMTATYSVVRADDKARAVSVLTGAFGSVSRDE